MGAPQIVGSPYDSDLNKVPPIIVNPPYFPYIELVPTTFLALQPKRGHSVTEGSTLQHETPGCQVKKL